MCALPASDSHSGVGVDGGRMHVLLAQMACGAGAIECNLRRLEDLLSEHPHAQIALFPELFLQGCCPASAAERAIAIDEGPIATVMAAAKRCQTAVIFGFAERLPVRSSACTARPSSSERWSAPSSGREESCTSSRWRTGWSLR
jgi:hypothetical protein